MQNNMMKSLNLYTCGLYLGLIIAVSIIVLLTLQHPRTVDLNYSDAALHWLARTPLYNNQGVGFIYFPQSALFFIPFAKLPFALHEILWRTLAVSLLGVGLFRFANTFGTKDNKIYFFLISLVSLALAADSARNGQFNLVVVDVILFALTDLVKERWWRVALYLTAGFFIKPTTVVILGLCMVLYRPLFSRILLLLIIGWLFPFLTANSAYVISQYHGMVNMLIDASNLGSSQTQWAQLFGLIGQTGYIISPAHQTILRIIFALLTVWVAFLLKKRLSKENFVLALFTISALYLMLFNPRTENDDYVILAPMIGFCLARAWEAKILWRQCFLSILILCLLSDYYLSAILIPGQTFGHSAWVAPLMAILFGVYYLPIILGQRSRNLKGM